MNALLNPLEADDTQAVVEASLYAAKVMHDPPLSNSPVMP
jgi:hypothetical protein